MKIMKKFRITFSIALCDPDKYNDEYLDEFATNFEVDDDTYPFENLDFLDYDMDEHIISFEFDYPTEETEDLRKTVEDHLEYIIHDFEENYKDIIYYNTRLEEI